MKQFALENMPSREPSARDLREVLLTLYKNGSWCIGSDIARKITSNDRGKAGKACKQFVEQGLALSEEAKEHGFETSVAMAYHITEKGIEKIKKIQKRMEDPETKNFFS